MKERGGSNRANRYPYTDVESCIVERCIGWNWPWLCHIETLRLAHFNGHFVQRRGRIAGVSKRKKA
jgi:hypothetical protein